LFINELAKQNNKKYKANKITLT